MVSNYSEEAKQMMRKYQREWRARNRDKVRAANQRYWERKAAELLNHGMEASRGAKVAAEEKLLAAIQGRREEGNE